MKTIKEKINSLTKLLEADSITQEEIFEELKNIVKTLSNSEDIRVKNCALALENSIYEALLSIEKANHLKQEIQKETEMAAYYRSKTAIVKN